ncbi:MAG TPA: dihydrolipoamide acetyltransferase family protein [Xanthomonadales bacterium]|nr:dihydrolipoamide acetyltransferase family protein [Xanthomonadales bacterium]
MSDRIYAITVPKWGIEMQEGTITEWRAAVGDTIERDQELVDIETDKIVNTLESSHAGVLRRIVVDADETLKVGALLGVISGADVDDAQIDSFIADFRPLDASFGVGEELETSAPSESAPPATKAPASAPPAARSAGKASPVARRLAEKLGVDLAQVEGTGRNGRISREDVEAAAQAASTTSTAEATSGSTIETLSPRAMTAAKRMTESKTTIPHFYLGRELDMSAALASKQSGGWPLTAGILKALATALAEHPRINAHFQDDSLKLHSTVDINVAVDTEDGLLAPLLKNVAGQSIDDVASSLKDIAQRARGNALKAGELNPGGITLSNLGMFGIDDFTAIINPPQLAILAVGRIRPRRFEMDGEEIPAMAACLSCDHRALDGATGARFLESFQQALNSL